MEKIDNFIRDRITMADQVITSLGLQKIQDGDVILTYARSSVVQGLLLAAHAKGIKFKVIVVDSRPRFEGTHSPSLLLSFSIASRRGVIARTLLAHTSLSFLRRK